ncbi:MAG: hypothetical protein ACK4EY_15185 [Flavipsychrobacter sp.]
MAYILTSTNVTKRLYPEVIDEISRADASIVQAAIEAAIDEAAGYMDRFDVDKILGTPTVNAVVSDGNLLAKLKDLFVWHFIAIGNANIEYGPAQERYMMAIEKYFERVQAGKIMPDKWRTHYRDISADPAPPDGLQVTAKSNNKRRNQFD